MNHLRRSAPWLGLALLLAAPSAWAAGGAHVVDDAAVETPGGCHLETWVSRYGPASGLANVSPGCTLQARPDLELDASLQHLWGGARDTLAGPAAKLNLRPVESGLGVALSAAGAWSLRSGRLETASVIVPVTAPLSRRLNLNLNAGWSYVRADAHRHALFLGAQAEAQVAPEFSLMAEAFGHDHGRAGGQLGLRWTPSGANLDLDLLVGRRVDGVSPTTLTLGLTVRR